MNTRNLRLFAAAGALLLRTAAFCTAAEPSKEDVAFSSKQLNALEKSDYDKFIANGSPDFQKIPKAKFEAVSAMFSPRFKIGYTVSYLGDLKQQGYHIAFWKLSFSNGSDDVLEKLVVKEGKIFGFFIN